MKSDVTVCLRGIVGILCMLVASSGCSDTSSNGSVEDAIGGIDASPKQDVSGGEIDPDRPPWTEAAPPLPALHVEGRYIRDEYGRTVLLRGANAGNQAKKPPHLPWEGAAYGEPGFQEDLERFYDFPFEWGLNCIRLTVFWEAVEPAPGEYSEDYVAQTLAQVEAANARGMYVFLDFHQDLYSRILGGSGAPAWALPDPTVEPIPLDDDMWFLKALQGEDALAAFDHFWANEEGVKDAYSSMAVWFSEQFADVPGVMGIDLMNEPTPGMDGKADLEAWFTDVLKPFYENLGTAIHEKVPRYILLIESTSLEAAGVSLGTALPRPDLDNLVFAPHYYNTGQFLTGHYDGKIETIAEGLGDWDENAEAFGTPLLLSEYGFRGYTEAGNSEIYLPDHYAVMDELFMHGTIWSHEVTSTYWNNEDCAFVNGDWEERPDMADPLARPYPRFTSGEWVSFHYDPATREVEFRYTVVDTSGAPTVLTLPRRHYPTVPAVTLAFGEWDFVPTTMELRVFDGDAAAGTEQVIQIAP